MQCKQCGGANDDERALECGYCGGVLRRAWPHDPVGKWLARLERRGGDRWGWLQNAVAVGEAALAGGLTALLWVTGLMSSPVALIGFGLGAWILLEALVSIAGPWSVARARRRFRDGIGAELLRYRRDTGMEAWRFLVLVAESLPGRGWAIRGQLLELEGEDEPQGQG